MYCMGNPDHRTPDEVVKLYFDNYRTNRDAPISEKEHAELMDILDFYQEQNENESKK